VKPWLLAALALPLAAGAADNAADLARKVREAGLDTQECYRVRDIALPREDARIYLTDGYLIFGKPVDGARISAVFSADVEGGDGEVLVMPPNRSERLSLATFTGSPNLNEHFRAIVMVFSDDTASVLAEAVRAAGAEKSAEMGHLLASTWGATVQNLASSFEVRLVLDLLERRADRGFFYAAIAGVRQGNFDLIVDARSRDQIALGQVAFRDARAFFDNWTIFQARSYRTGRKKTASPDFDISDIRIQATLDPDLTLKARTIATVTPRTAGLKALQFEVTNRMRLNEVRVEGETVEFFQRDSLRANAIRGSDNGMFLVIPARELPVGRAARVEFMHEGKVVAQAGNGVYYVGSRGTWYPQRGIQFARYDLTFRYPKDLNLVATGEVVEDRTEGDWRITRRRTTSPIRMAGFNLGRYEQVNLDRGGYRVEVYANRRVENALQPKPVPLPPSPIPHPWARGGRRQSDLPSFTFEQPPPDPTANLSRLAGEIAAAFEFMARIFGPPPLKILTVSPIPGAFGQGFPGLVYLSTLSYLDPRERPAGARGETQQYFFSDVLHSHETAHQWWGNTVIAATYQDEWLTEALAHYSALMYLERKSGVRALEEMLSWFRDHLLKPNEAGKTLESAGPITWGARLNSSLAPDAWRTIMYEKGAWIIHMLRRRMGDASFLKFLGEICRRYQFQLIDTEQFRVMAREFLPARSPDPDLEEFFDHYVYGTGIPELRLEYSIRGKAPNLRLTGTVKQTGVGDDFSVLVPVEIQFARGKPVTHWVSTSKEPEKFSLTLKVQPARVVLAPGEAVLASELEEIRK
jgi:hypothetical protein